MAQTVNRVEQGATGASQAAVGAVSAPSVPKVDVEEVAPPSPAQPSEQVPLDAYEGFSEATQAQAAPQQQQARPQAQPQQQGMSSLSRMMDVVGKPQQPKTTEAEDQRPRQQEAEERDTYSRFKPVVSPSRSAAAARSAEPEEVGDGLSIVDPDDPDRDIVVPSSLASIPVSADTAVHSDRGIRAMRAQYEREQAEKEEQGQQEQEPEAEKAAASQAGDTPVTTTVPVPRPRLGAVTNEIPKARTRDAQKEQEGRAKTGVKRRLFGGVAVSDKLGGERKRRLREVSVGSDILEEVLRIPNSGLLQRVQDETGIEFDQTSPNLLVDVITAINNSNIKVATSKSPVNVLSSYQSRILRVHAGRGVKIHPIMAKLYNADFDGDEMTVSFSRRYAFKAVDPMRTVFDQKGDLLVDPDFFPWATLVGNLPWEGGETYEQYFNDNVFHRRNKEERAYLSKLIGAYCGQHEDEDEKKEALRNYFKGVFKVASKYPSRDAIVDDLILDTYNALRYLSLVQAQLMPDVKVTSYDDMPQPQNTHDRALVKVSDDLVRGVVPMNFQAVKEKMTAYVGEGGDNKNLAFRFTANICKMFRIDHTLVIGNEEGFEEIFDGLMQYVYSKRISNAEFSDAKSAAAGETLRSAIIAEVGFPHQYLTGTTPEEVEDAFRRFAARFINEYQRQSAAINLANMRIYSDFDIEFGGADLVRKIEGKKIGDMVTPFINVYGEYTMRYIFGDMLKLDRDAPGHARRMSGLKGGKFFVDKAYGDRKLRDFSKHNKLRVGSDARRKSKGKMSKDGRVEDLVYAIADARTSSASAFATSVYSAEDSMCARLRKVLGYLNQVAEECAQKGTLTPLMQESDNVIDVLRAFGGDLFSFYEMDNMDGFLKSEYGRKLVESKNAAQVGGIRLAMLVERRMARIEAEVAKRDELVKADAPAWKIAVADNAVHSEIATLASSSPTWRSIMKEVTCAKSARAWDGILQDMQQPYRNRKLPNLNGNSPVQKVNGKDRGTGVTYWQNPKHDNLLDFLLDTNIGYRTKTCVLSDVVRWHESWEWMESFEVASQLEEDASPAFSELGPNGKSIFDVKRDFDGRYKRWKKRNRYEIMSDVEKARGLFGQGMLETHLRYLADNPEEHVEMPDEVYYDALTAALDKQYGQSEKSRQHTAVNAFYAAISYSLRGGVYNDVYRTDDRVLGQKAAELITVQDVVSLLAYPDRTLDVYDEYGQPGVLSRDALCGKEGADENDVWDYLIENPNIAAACRTHSTHVKNFGKGGAYLSNTRTFSDSVDYTTGRSGLTAEKAKKKALSVLRDDPTFGGLVMALVPTENRASRQIRPGIRNAEDLSLELAYRCALEYRDTGRIEPFSITGEVRSAHWSPITVFKEDSDADKKKPSRKVESEGVYEYDANDLNRIVLSGLKRFSERLLEKNENGVTVLDMLEAADAYQSDPNEDFDAKFSVRDKQAFSNFFDIRQELNGAKTQISTGVEGTTTYMLFPWVALLQTRDRYAALNELDPDTYDALQGCQTNVKVKGKLVKIGDSGLTVDDILDADPKAVVEVPVGYVVPDKTSDPRPDRQLSSIVAWLMTKRDDGAEKHNLKIKKYGSDKRNSVTKHDTYVDASELPDQVKRAYEAGGRIEALSYLGSVIKKANGDLGYEDMTLANCMCIADLMLLKTEDGGVALDEHGMPVIRSVEQLATAIKTRMPRSLVEGGDMDQLAEAAGQIAAEVGTVAMLNPNEAVSRLRTMATSWFHPVIKEESSSYERNLNLLNNISRAHKVRPWGEKKLNEESKKVLARNKKNLAAEHDWKFWGSYKPIGVVGSTVYHQVPGMSAMLVMDKLTVDGKALTAEVVKDALLQAFRMGNTAYVSREAYESGLLPESIMDEAIPYGDGTGEDGYIIPFFDMRLNGYFKHNGTGTFAIFQCDESRIVSSYEDMLNEYSLGDSACQMFMALFKRLFMHKVGCWETSVSDLFAVTYSKYPEADMSVKLADDVTIRKYVVNGAEPFDIDYGMDPTAPGFAARKARVDAAINKYRQEYAYAGEDGLMHEMVRAGDVIGWADLTVFDPGKMTAPRHVLAPIMPFDMSEKSNVPTQYDVKDVSFSKDGFSDAGTLSMNWELDASLLHQYVKMHEGAGAANKNMVWLDPVEGLNFEDGTPIDCCYAAATTKSRRGGTDRRIRSMETMMFFARRHGYNFAEVEGTFPDDEELRNMLREERLSRDFWARPIEYGKFEGTPRIELYLDGRLKFSSDPEINEFLIHEVKKFWDNGGTPSDYLASRFGGEKSGIWWEFPAMFEQNHEYQRRLLRFHHMMEPGLCPDGFEGATGDELFLPNPGNPNDPKDFGYGVLKMRIPRRSASNPNEVYWIRGEVFSGWSFFGEDFSAMKRPSVNGSQVTMEVLNMMLLTGRAPSGYDYRNLVKWAMSDLGDVQDAAYIEGELADEGSLGEPDEPVEEG